MEKPSASPVHQRLRIRPQVDAVTRSAVEAVNATGEARQAFARIGEELDALSPAEVTLPNVDVVPAISIVLGVADRVRAFRAQMATLPDFDLRHVDGLRDYALATLSLYSTNWPTADPKELPELRAEVVALRAMLLLWAAPLAAHGHFDPRTLDKIRRTRRRLERPAMCSR
jgi:hypothetical protein